MLDFWATWCGPCRTEIPHLVEVQQEYGDKGLQIVGVTLDNAADTNVTEFLKQQNMNWPQIHSGGRQIAARYGVEGIPAAFLIDGTTGELLARGDDLRGDKLSQTIAKNLNMGNR